MVASSASYIKLRGLERKESLFLSEAEGPISEIKRADDAMGSVKFYSSESFEDFEPDVSYQ